MEYFFLGGENERAKCSRWMRWGFLNVTSYSNNPLGASGVSGLSRTTFSTVTVCFHKSDFHLSFSSLGTTGLWKMCMCEHAENHYLPEPRPNLWNVSSCNTVAVGGLRLLKTNLRLVVHFDPLACLALTARLYATTSALVPPPPPHHLHCNIQSL